MNKKAISALILMLVIFSNNSIHTKSKISSAKKAYDAGLEIGLDLGVVERRMSFVYDFFDQSEEVQNNLFGYQQSLYSIVLLPMHEKCNGSYKKMISMIKKEIKLVGSVLKRGQKVEIPNQPIIDKLTKRRTQLNSLLLFIASKHSVVRSLWNSVSIDSRYGTLIKAYKALPRESGCIPVANEAFEKELLYTSFKNISRQRRNYPTAYFMDKCLSKDIDKCKKECIKSFNKGYDTNLIKQKCQDLEGLKSTIEQMAPYLQQKKSRSKYRMAIAFVWLLFSPIAAIACLCK